MNVNERLHIRDVSPRTISVTPSGMLGHPNLWGFNMTVNRLEPLVDQNDYEVKQ